MYTPTLDPSACQTSARQPAKPYLPRPSSAAKRFYSSNNNNNSKENNEKEGVKNFHHHVRPSSSATSTNNKAPQQPSQQQSPRLACRILDSYPLAFNPNWNNNQKNNTVPSSTINREKIEDFFGNNNNNNNISSNFYQQQQRPENELLFSSTQVAEMIRAALREAIRKPLNALYLDKQDENEEEFETYEEEVEVDEEVPNNSDDDNDNDDGSKNPVFKRVKKIITKTRPVANIRVNQNTQRRTSYSLLQHPSPATTTTIMTTAPQIAVTKNNPHAAARLQKRFDGMFSRHAPALMENSEALSAIDHAINSVLIFDDGSAESEELKKDPKKLQALWDEATKKATAVLMKDFSGGGVSISRLPPRKPRRIELTTPTPKPSQNLIGTESPKQQNQKKHETAGKLKKVILGGVSNINTKKSSRGSASPATMKSNSSSSRETSLNRSPVHNNNPFVSPSPNPNNATNNNKKSKNNNKNGDNSLKRDRSQTLAEFIKNAPEHQGSMKAIFASNNNSYNEDDDEDKTFTDTLRSLDNNNNNNNNISNDPIMNQSGSLNGSGSFIGMEAGSSSSSSKQLQMMKQFKLQQQKERSKRREFQEKSTSLLYATTTAAQHLILYRDAVENELTCPCCFRMVSDPHFLIPCAHTFCKSCIQREMKVGTGKSAESLIRELRQKRNQEKGEEIFEDEDAAATTGVRKRINDDNNNHDQDDDEDDDSPLDDDDFNNDPDMERQDHEHRMRKKKEREEERQLPLMNKNRNSLHQNSGGRTWYRCAVCKILTDEGLAPNHALAHIRARWSFTQKSCMPPEKTLELFSEQVSRIQRSSAGNNNNEKK